METRQVLTHGRITPEGVERTPAHMVRHELRQTFRFNTEVTHDNIRHYCWGIGDDNPLWMDPAYASRSDYGGSGRPAGLPLDPAPDLGADRPPRGCTGSTPGPTGRSTARSSPETGRSSTIWLEDVVEKEGRFGGHSVILYFRSVFSNAQDQLLADVLSWSFRIERHRSREGGGPARRPEDEDLDGGRAGTGRGGQLAERPRGADNRLWEDVEVGETMDPVVKGPLCLTDMIAWYTGSSPVYQPAHELALKWYRRHRYRFEVG